jgi:hypothetical protein
MPRREERRRKHEIGRFFIRFQLLYMLGINKIEEILQKKKFKK